MNKVLKNIIFQAGIALPPCDSGALAGWCVRGVFDLMKTSSRPRRVKIKMGDQLEVYI